jgi:hypothetical protein
MSLPPDLSPRTPSSPEPSRGPAPDADDTPPPGGRAQDQGRDEFERALAEQPARPLTGEEREAAERDPGPAERVHAPAAARTPKPPLPGHDAIVGSPDASTPERRALPADEPAAPPPRPRRGPRGTIVLGAGTVPLAAAGAATAAWRYARWRRERDRPMARIRRRVRRAAADLGHRLPAGGELARHLLADERARPVGGLALGALIAALLVNRALRARATPGHPLDGRAGLGR